MRKQNTKKLACLCAAMLVLAGCGSRLKNTLLGGASGAAAGAGIGAIVGTVITNGDVPGSALAGAAVGLPVGLILGLALSVYDTQIQENDINEIYAKNQRDILRRQQEIESLRNAVREEAPVGKPSPRLRRHIYNGPSLGNNFR
jgi:hypothetical protein